MSDRKCAKCGDLDRQVQKPCVTAPAADAIKIAKELLAGLDDAAHIARCGPENIRALCEAALEQEWQSIETAPKDGSLFLVFDNYYGVRVGRACERANYNDWLSYVDNNPSKEGVRAIHWRPLPPLPKGDEK